MPTTTFHDISWVNIACIIWLLIWWIGYSFFAKIMAKRSHCLASALHAYRIEWMDKLLLREHRIADATLLAALERNVSFFASTTMLILAGIVTVLTRTNNAFTVLEELPFTVVTTTVELQVKLLVLISIFIYAFFTFTWSMRQYGFCSIMLGAAPMHDDKKVSEENKQLYAVHAAKLLDQAGHGYNFGLRSYYFAAALLVWFINPWLFMLAVSLVVSILYRREFHSKPLKSLLRGRAS